MADYSGLTNEQLLSKVNELKRLKLIRQGMTSPEAGIRSKAYGEQFETPSPTFEESLGQKVAEKKALLTAEEEIKGITEPKQAALKESALAATKAGRVKNILPTIQTLWEATDPQSAEKSILGYPSLGRRFVAATGKQKNTIERAIKIYKDFTQGIRAVLARGFGDVGNLSEYEQRAVIQTLPSVGGLLETGDFSETGADKLKNLDKILNDIIEARQAGYKDLKDYQAIKSQKSQEQEVITLEVD